VLVYDARTIGGGSGGPLVDAGTARSSGSMARIWKIFRAAITACPWMPATTACGRRHESHRTRIESEHYLALYKTDHEKNIMSCNSGRSFPEREEKIKK
jgi:hypothetical protein